MHLLSGRELQEYFRQRDNRFTNSKGMHIGWYDSGAHTSLSLPLYETVPPPYEFEIITSEEGFDDFIQGFGIQTVKDIDQLDYNHSWIRYLKGNAEVQITSMELEASFSFRIYKSRTTIASLNLHFYDECYRHLTLPDEFVKYFTDNEQRLHAAAANQYKF